MYAYTYIHIEMKHICAHACRQSAMKFPTIPFCDTAPM